MILTAGLGTRIAVVAQGRAKATLPAGRRPALVSQVQQLRRLGILHVAVVHAIGDDRQLRPLVDQVFAGAGLELTFVLQEAPTGPLEAFACAADVLEASGETLLILGDTLVDDLSVLPVDSVGVGHVDAVREFCIARTDQAGRISGYEDKPDRDGPSDEAVAGVYSFGDTGLLQKLLRDSATVDTGELSDLLKAYGDQHPLTAVPVSGWRDLGAYERYIDANQRTFFGRADHSFAVDDAGSVVKGGDEALMAAQVQWYRSLPDTAAGLAPRLLGAGKGWYSVELLDYPSLSQLLLYEPLPPSTWAFLLSRLLEVTETRLWAPTRRPGRGTAAWCERKYITKTEHRLSQWQEWARLRGRRLVVDGNELPAFEELWPVATAALRALGGRTWSCFIHGDMTFSNILLVRGHGMFKLLDPGTAFSESSWGDVRYDLAKLRQCYAGAYDAFAGDLFELERHNVAQWDVHLLPRPSQIADVGDGIVADLGYDLWEIRLLEAVQFLSMTPLHCENPDRQLAFYGRGLQQLTWVLDNTQVRLAGAS